MNHTLKKDPTSISIIINIVLLMLAVGAYVFVDKYLTATANDKVDLIENKTEGELSDEDAIKIAKEKYYLAIATITNTTADIDKLYNQIKTENVSLTDAVLIQSLNSLGAKTFTLDDTVKQLNDYEKAITDNFTADFIKNNIMIPNGFIGKVNDDYYMVRDKKDNFLFKEAKFSLVSKNEQEMVFTVVDTNYTSDCISGESAMPNIACTDTKESSETHFKIIKESSKWKIAQMEINIA